MVNHVLSRLSEAVAAAALAVLPAGASNVPAVAAAINNLDFKATRARLAGSVLLAM